MPDQNFCKGDVCFVDFPDGVGHEQKGDRPAVIVADVSPAGIAIVIPLTTSTARLDLPFTCTIGKHEKNGLLQDGVALVFQLRSIDKIRLRRKIGCLGHSDQKQLDALIRKLLGLE